MGRINTKKDYDYFEGFARFAEFASEEAVYLRDALADFDPDAVGAHVGRLHNIEHAADLEKHELTRHLAREFITPIEREDISALAQGLDDIVDGVEDIMRQIYMFNLRELRSETSDFCELIVRCAAAFELVTHDFKDFKRSRKLNELIIEVNSLESEGDRLHTAALRRLYSGGESPETLIIWTAVFESMERCLDAFEDAADLIESVVMKNS